MTGHKGTTDTRAICHIDLAAVGGSTNTKLVNTCSYPSQEPTSAPADCVLIPADSFLKIVKNASPIDETFSFTTTGYATGCDITTWRHGQLHGRHSRPARRSR